MSICENISSRERESQSCGHLGRIAWYQDTQDTLQSNDEHATTLQAGLIVVGALAQAANDERHDADRGGTPASDTQRSRYAGSQHGTQTLQAEISTLLGEFGLRRSHGRKGEEAVAEVVWWSGG